MRVGLTKLRLLVACLLIGLAMAGCQAQFVADYDEIFDRAVTDTQKKTDAFLQKLAEPRSPLRVFARAKDSYDDILNDIHSLKIRAEANNSGGLNAETLIQIEKTAATIRELRALHANDARDVTDRLVVLTQQTVDVQFSSMLKFENLKRRGEAKKKQ